MSYFSWSSTRSFHSSSTCFFLCYFAPFSTSTTYVYVVRRTSVPLIRRLVTEHDQCGSQAVLVFFFIFFFLLVPAILSRLPCVPFMDYVVSRPDQPGHPRLARGASMETDPRDRSRSGFLAHRIVSHCHHIPVFAFLQFQRSTPNTTTHTHL